jgi:NAD(P)-dependent dehydrogenase (short-subunit alcohol dehydrogenase family)
MGVANDHSIAWGIARMLAAQGATLAFTYQGEALGRRVRPLAESVGASLVLPCDVEQLASVDVTFAAIAEKWGSLDFLVHAIAFSDKNELRGRYADTTRENFVRTMIISCFSFTEVAKRAAALMSAGGTTTSWGLPRPRSKRRCAISRSISARAPFASMPSRPGRSARWRVPASPMRGRCSPSSSAIRRCAAA